MNSRGKHEVHTRWGWFSLDEGAYQDYLKGKLWITWGEKRDKTGSCDEAPAPVAADGKALRLRDKAEKEGVFALLQQVYPAKSMPIPYKDRMRSISINEMCLSVRSCNGLMRSGTDTFGKLYAHISGERGLRGIRNLGEKSEQEILRCFITACYERLSANEKAAFWQAAADCQD